MLSLAFTVRSTDEAFADAFRWHLAPFHRATADAHALRVGLYVREEDEDETPAPYSFFISSNLRYRHASLTEVLGGAIWSLHAWVTERTRDFLLLHAAGVARDGMAALVAGAAESGKSSLAAALLQKGFQYLSDEAAAIDPITQKVFPFSKHISLDAEALRFFPGLEDRLDDRSGISAGLRERYVRPADVGSNVAAASHVRLLFFPTPEFGGVPTLDRVPRAEAVQMMASNSFNLYRYADRGLVLLSRIAEDAEAFRLSGGTPSERADLITERFG